MNDADFEKLRQLQSKIIASTFAIPSVLLGASSSLLITNAMKSTIRNNEFIASLCYMSDKPLQEVVEICQRLPYDLADIQAYYRMYGEFPE